MEERSSLTCPFYQVTLLNLEIYHVPGQMNPPLFGSF